MNPDRESPKLPTVIRELEEHIAAAQNIAEILRIKIKKEIKKNKEPTEENKIVPPKNNIGFTR